MPEEAPESNGQKRCQGCGSAAVPKDEDLCKPCRIRRDHGEEARQIYLKNLASRAGRASVESRSGPKGLRHGDLPPLTTHSAAEEWTDTIGRAVAMGRISANAANAALRAVREWRQSREDGQVSERLEQLLDALSEWRKTGDPEPVLELVEGGRS